MKCIKCGATVKENENFCTNCGHPVNNKKAEGSTMQLKCKACGGTLTVDADRMVLSCPYCGSKELITESDYVTIQRIKSKTAKEIEEIRLEYDKKRLQYEEQKLRLEEAKAKRMYEQMRKQEKKEEGQAFLKSGFAMLLVGMIILCILSVCVCANDSRNTAGGIAIVQTVLFMISWLMGIKAIGEIFPKMHILFALAGFLLIIPFFSYY